MLRCTVRVSYDTILEQISCIVIDFLSNLHTGDWRCFISVHPFLCQNRRSGRIISGRLTVDNKDWHVTHFLTAITFLGKWIVHKDIERIYYEMQSRYLATKNIREIAFKVLDDVKLEYMRYIHRLIRTLDYIKVWWIEILFRYNEQNNIFYWKNLSLMRIIYKSIKFWFFE